MGYVKKRSRGKGKQGRKMIEDEGKTERDVTKKDDRKRGRRWISKGNGGWRRKKQGRMRRTENGKVGER